MLLHQHHNKVVSHISNEKLYKGVAVVDAATTSSPPLLLLMRCLDACQHRLKRFRFPIGQYTAKAGGEGALAKQVGQNSVAHPLGVHVISQVSYVASDEAPAAAVVIVVGVVVVTPATL